MENITLKQINENILSLKTELNEIKELLEEYNLELKDEVKLEIEKSRRRQTPQFKSQKEIEKKFL